MAAFSDPEVMAAMQDGRHFTMFASFILVVVLIFLSSPRSAIYGVFHHFHPSTLVARKMLAKKTRKHILAGLRFLYLVVFSKYIIL